MNDMKKSFEDIDLSIKHKNFSNKKIIFICGMPRSGTTLVEQIISSHKKFMEQVNFIFIKCCS